MITFPNIKINLGLYITRRRNDGFHNLLSCFYPVDWCDILEVVPSDKFEFVQTGIEIPGNQEENLCCKAYYLLKEHFDLPPARIHLHKIIPMGAGLGGGSSDAAFTLKSLNTVFRLNLNDQQLAMYAAQLGSDCAFFIGNKPAIASSRGEVLHETTLDLKGKWIAIVCPGIHISTKQAFSGVNPKVYDLDFAEVLSQTDHWPDQLHNQFEDTVFPLQPELKLIKEDLYQNGAFYASMSGSGSSLFGLFEKEPDLDLTTQIAFKGIL